MIVKFLGDRAAENEYRMVFNQLENSSPWNTADIKSPIQKKDGRNRKRNAASVKTGGRPGNKKAIP